jgi:hypothetical protein
MRGSKDSTASRVTRGAGSKGGKKKLAIDASVAKKLSAAHRGRGRRGANNAVARNFQSLAKPLKWPGKATDVIPVEVGGKELKAIALTDDMIYHCEPPSSLKPH